VPRWLYVILCVVAPCGVGGVMYVVFSAVDRARRRRRPDEPPPQIDYLI